MNVLEEVKEMFLVADNHYLGAINSYNANKKGLYYKYDPTNHILNFCELAGEIYLKGYLKRNNIPYENNHNLDSIIHKCITTDSSFQNLIHECSLLVTFTSKINYPNELNIKESTIVKTINSVEKIMRFSPIDKIRVELGIPLPVWKPQE